MAALLPLPIGCGNGVTVKPMTLGMWAALERIGSPLVTGEEPKDALELIPSLYLLTHDPREVFRGNVVDLSMQWADTVPVATMDAIRRACYPAGLPRSSTGQPRPTTGASRKSCGPSRSPRSASCGGRRKGTKAAT